VEQSAPHESVLYDEVLSRLEAAPGGCYIDGTIGAGGHAKGILTATAPDGRLLGLDADPSALEISRQRLESFGDRVTLVNANFGRLGEVAERMGFDQVDGVLLDLGLSSMQLADPARGFSFRLEGPLDMRFDPGTSRVAADLVNSLSERDLADVIYRYGEEPAARSIARAIVAARPVHTTTELAEVVAQARRGRAGRFRHRTSSWRHPATRTFQALRVAVNAELENLECGLDSSLRVLRPGGRLAVITFHSLEDRVAKRLFARESRDCICPPEALTCSCDHRARVELITKKPVLPSSREVGRNPRSRSAKLRVVAKR
jgi:16S rRNA (cytosine1402-N4)-methyltransferase